MTNAITLTDGTDPNLRVRFETFGGYLTLKPYSEAGTLADVWLDAAEEAKLLDYLTARANAGRDRALKELHQRRYFDQGPSVRRDLPPATALEGAPTLQCADRESHQTHDHGRNATCAGVAS